MENVIQVIQQEKTSKSGKTFGDKGKRNEHIAWHRKKHKAEQVYRTQRRKEKRSLFSRMERSTEIKRNMMRTRAAASEINAEEANKQYV